MKTKIKKRKFGNTGIEVTELCFGTLPMGPLQMDMGIEEGSEVIASALDKGVNFIDTAQMYGTYAHIKAALKKTSVKPVIATKSFASSYQNMERAVEEALSAMELDCIDIFHLHAARTDDKVFSERAEAFQCLLDYRKKGKIRAVGLSTHSVKAVNKASAMDGVDIVFPIINKTGLGILQGTLQDMLAAIARCVAAGKGIYLMKVLGGGNLINDYYGSMEFAMSLPGWSSIALGMVSEEEVEFNIRYFVEGKIEEAPRLTGVKKKFIAMEVVCNACGTCIEKCPSQAIVAGENGKAFIQEELCTLCGYCVNECPQFAIRMI
ncbi:MAG: aldo/keto reductase [Spirochaetales bacterium]|nr:aldo/keto reductase [Spirochaetales bacterium]